MPATESDKLLVQLIRRHPPKSAEYEQAWADLYARYQGRLRAYARRRLRDGASPDDVVGETFAGFLTSLPHYDESRDLQTWLFTIASRRVTDVLRRTGRRPFRPGNDADQEQLDRRTDPDQRPASSMARSREQREQEEEHLGRALRSVVREWAERGDYLSIMTLELLLVKGLPNVEVARRLGRTEGQVATVKFAAKRRLQDHLRATGLNPDVFPELAGE